MPESVRIGIVGLGRLGRRHAENLAFRIPGARLVAAASPIEAERAWARASLGGAAAYAGLDELLAHPGLDAVWLATPTSLHANQVVASIEAGKHVFCEKPLALDPVDCDRAVAAAAGHPGQVVMVGFMRRFDPAYREAKRRIDAGDLGEVFAIRCVSEDPVDPDGFFVRFAPTSGGIFLDCCIHDIDLVRWMLDGVEASSVTAAGSRIMYPALGECGDVDTGCATVAFKGGQVASFYVSRTSHRGYEASMTIVGTKAAGVARSSAKSTSSNVSARPSCTRPARSSRRSAMAAQRRSASKTRARPRDWPAPCAPRSRSPDAPRPARRSGQRRLRSQAVAVAQAEPTPGRGFI